MKPRESLIAIALSACLGVSVIFFVGGPISWDEMLYMNLSMNTTKNPSVLNRYAHIYLQKLFIWAAGDAVLGAEIFWCFLIALTILLIYLSARLLSENDNYLIGVIALLFFFSQDLVFEVAGVTYADFTVMAFLALGTFIYILALKAGNATRRWLLVAFGLTLFLAFKSKETGLLLAVLIPGLLAKRQGKARSSQRPLKDLGLITGGLALGIALLILADYLILSDPWFSFRPSSFRGLLDFNLGYWPRRSSTYYSFISQTTLFFPFLLYLLCIWTNPPAKFAFQKKVLWLLPIAVIIFLTFIISRGKFVVIQRYFIPAVPIICIFAPLFFQEILSFSVKNSDDSDESTAADEHHANSGVMLENAKASVNPKSSIRQPLKLVIIFASAGLIVFLLDKNILPAVTRIRWNKLLFSSTIIAPIAISFLLILKALVRKWDVKWTFLSLLCFFFIVWPPISTNYSSLKHREVAKKSEARFYPIKTFEKHINIRDDMRILISRNINKELKMLSRSRSSSIWMFNIYFNEDLSRGNFIATYDPFVIFRNKYSYVFLSPKDWQKLSSPKVMSKVQKLYSVIEEEKHHLVFLKSKDEM